VLRADVPHVLRADVPHVRACHTCDVLLAKVHTADDCPLSSSSRTEVHS
jgi:hypothetical protein